MQVGEPVRGRLLFDGRQTTERPDAWPSLVQVVDGDGAVAHTAYLFPEEPLPPYEAKPLPTEPPMATGGRGPKPAFLVSAGGAAVAAGALYGAAALTNASFQEDHPDWTNDDLVAAQRRNNAFLVASGTAAGVAVASLGVAFVGSW